MSTPNSDVNYRNRHARLAEVMSSANLGGIALNAGPSLTYMTGLHFHLSERPVIGLFTVNFPPVIVLPEFEAGKLTDLSYETKAFTYGEDPGTWQAVFQEGLQAAGLSGQQVGIEPLQLRVLESRLLDIAEGTLDLVSGASCLAELRMQKDQSEQADMQQAVYIAQNALEATLPKIKPGITEQELAAELVVGLLREGSESEMPFAPIIASGPNSANPHATPTDRRLAKGDMLVIDWGASVGGYFSDLTRTFSIWGPEAEMAKIAQIVLEANESARMKAGPGVPVQDVDRAARRVIEQAGYGEYFTHRTGHGLGMEGHEEPYIREGIHAPLKPGMTFTIEPGLYLPGRGGVRIEDDVVITENGLHSFSDMPRALRVLGD
jgi:Xaa-Pro dipeptidase